MIKTLIVSLAFVAATAFAGDEDLKKRADETLAQYRSRIVRIVSENVEFNRIKTYTFDNVFQIIDDAKKEDRFSMAVYEYANVNSLFPSEISDADKHAAWLDLFMDVYLTKYPDVRIEYDDMIVFDTGLSQQLRNDYPERAIAEFEAKDLLVLFKSAKNINYRYFILNFLTSKKPTPVLTHLLVECMEAAKNPYFNATLVSQLAKMPVVDEDDFKKILKLYSVGNFVGLGKLFSVAAIRIYVTQVELPQTHLKLFKGFIGEVRKASYFYGVPDLIAFNETLLKIQKNPLSRLCTRMYMGFDFVKFVVMPM